MQHNKGFYDMYGGAYIPEVLRPAVVGVQEAFDRFSRDENFLRHYRQLLRDFVGRPTPLVYAQNISEELGGARIFIKLEGLAHTGAHKINNALGQVLLARFMGKKRVIAETGAGQHGIATAAACAKLGLPCTVYMGKVDIERQRPNVFWMEQFGATVVSVESGSQTLKDAVNEALRDWAYSCDDTFYCIGSALGPHPYPAMVHFFQSIIGNETVAQITSVIGRSPDIAVACVGGGSNAIGFFSPFLEERSVRLIGVEAGGKGLGTHAHASRITGNAPIGIVQGYKSRFLQDNNGQLAATHSISAGLDYPGIGPELAALADNKRIEFTTATDEEALQAFSHTARKEGILPALESSHALHAAYSLAPSFSRDHVIVVNMSGRGEKDLFITAGVLGGKEWMSFLQAEGARLCKESQQHSMI